MTKPHLFCFGLGYSGLTLAHKLLADGWLVSGTCRTKDKADRLIREGIGAFVFTGEQAMRDISSALDGVTHVLNSAPPDTALDPVLRYHRADLEAIANNLHWAGYLSTIGVYGDCGGEWIDETRPATPLSAGSQQRLDAEMQWLDFGKRSEVPTHIFRLPGIYGPNGRSSLDALKAGRAHRILKDGQVFNRIHVEDLAQTLMASIQRPNGGRIYNVSDDEPSPAQDVTTFAASLLAMDPPPEVKFEDAALPPFAADFYAECKRIKNERIKSELGITLKYPTYREGLSAIAE
jgi:nucleoside-diphosphate-sugar epimerase